MKRLLVILIILAVGAACAWVIAPSLYKTFGRGSAYTAERCCEMSPLYKALNLTAQQKEEIVSSEKTFLGKKKELCMELCKRRDRLSQLLAQPDALPDQVYAQIDLVVASQGRMERLVADRVLEVRALLTPEQKERYAKKLEEAMCKSFKQRGLCGFQKK